MSSHHETARRPQVLEIFRAGYPSAADGGGGTLRARARGQIAAMARAYQVPLTAGGGRVGAPHDRCCSFCESCECSAKFVRVCGYLSNTR